MSQDQQITVCYKRAIPLNDVTIHEVIKDFSDLCTQHGERTNNYEPSNHKFRRNGYRVGSLLIDESLRLGRYPLIGTYKIIVSGDYTSSLQEQELQVLHFLKKHFSRPKRVMNP